MQNRTRRHLLIGPPSYQFSPLPRALPGAAGWVSNTTLYTPVNLSDAQMYRISTFNKPGKLSDTKKAENEDDVLDLHCRLVFHFLDDKYLIAVALRHLWSYFYFPSCFQAKLKRFHPNLKYFRTKFLNKDTF